MLSGWNRRGLAEPVDETTLERATESLQRFDVLFICERSHLQNHTALLFTALGLDSVNLRQDNRHADQAAKTKLAPRLASDLPDVITTLRNLNLVDSRLYTFALDLDDARIRWASGSSLSSSSSSTSSSSSSSSTGELPSRHHPDDDDTCEAPPRRVLDAKHGIFRPPGHKH